MEKLKKNIISTYGAAGTQWLSKLPETIAMVQSIWNLQQIAPVGNMTYSYVAKALSKDYGSVVVKIHPDLQLMQDEVGALVYFDGHGMVRLFDYDFKHLALLLYQAEPGRSLLELSGNSPEQAIQIYAQVIKKLMQAPKKQKRPSKNMINWLSALDKADTSHFPHNLLNKAINIKNKLTNKTDREYPLHGDLHCDNIVSDHNNHPGTWIAIDPKGIMGTVAFEAAQYDFLKPLELHHPESHIIFKNRSTALSHALEVDETLLKQWAFVRRVLAACWIIEDNGNPQLCINFAQCFYKGLT